MPESTLNTIRIRIDPGNSIFEGSISNLRQDLKDHRISFFAGAGISVPSGLPLAGDLCKGLLTTMKECLEIINLGTKDERILVDKILKDFRLERILDSLLESYTDNEILDYLSVLQDANENYNHFAIASLAGLGLISHVITLNFDTLFEQALSKEQIKYSWFLPLSSPVLIPDSTSQFIILKPHGTLCLKGFPYDTHYLSATLQYAGDRPQIENIEAIKSVLSRDPVLFVAGYSDCDWDISPILMQIPWSHVYWCQYNSKEILNETVVKWLNSRPSNSTTIFLGDVRKIFCSLLNDINDKYIYQDSPVSFPDSTIFLQNPVATSLAAIRLLDGTSNELYCKLLPQFENKINKENDSQLFQKWEKTMAWCYHAHKRNIREAIKINLRQYKNTYSRSDEISLNKIKDTKSIYYEYLSAVKRPHSNLRWPIDLIIAFRYRSNLKNQARRIISSDKVNSWIHKETEKQVAFTDYYLIDLFHNWGYYLLPFNCKPVRFITRILFRFIFKQYLRLSHLHPILDWEYHYVRSIEAALIAKERLQKELIKNKLFEILEMFNDTKQLGHADYVKSIIAILDEEEKVFKDIEKSFFDDSTGTSPTGKLRMILFRKYFWPNTMNSSTYSLLKDLSKYTRVQKD